jgi:hypothetical protein
MSTDDDGLIVVVSEAIYTPRRRQETDVESAPRVQLSREERTALKRKIGVYIPPPILEGESALVVARTRSGRSVRAPLRFVPTLGGVEDDDTDADDSDPDTEDSEIDDDLLVEVAEGDASDTESTVGEPEEVDERELDRQQATEAPTAEDAAFLADETQSSANVESSDDNNEWAPVAAPASAQCSTSTSRSSSSSSGSVTCSSDSSPDDDE